MLLQALTVLQLEAMPMAALLTQQSWQQAALSQMPQLELSPLQQPAQQFQSQPVAQAESGSAVQTYQQGGYTGLYFVRNSDLIHSRVEAKPSAACNASAETCSWKLLLEPSL